MTPERNAIDKQALLRRVNRRLSARGERVYRSRGSWAERQWGDWFLVDLQSKKVSGGVEIEVMARQLGALRDWERLATEVPA
jgi:hypothetical protein